MERTRVIVLLIAGFALIGPACVPPAPPSGESPRLLPEQQLVRRITAAVVYDPDFQHRRPGAGMPAVRALVNPGLTLRNDQGERIAVLAEAVPTIENGHWRLHSDGSMETTWTLRPGAKWHDGAPFTTDDLAFTLEVGRDRAIPGLGHVAHAMIEEVTPIDARVIRVRWNRPYIDADALFADGFALPLPRHRLEAGYGADKENFFDLAFWTTEYLGTGPFQLRSFVPGSSILLDANPDYVLGRPKVDEVEVKVHLDPNTLVANILGGQVDVVFYGVGSIDQGLALQEQWREGKVFFASVNNWIVMYAQFIDPHPAVITDLRFRRALLHAMDREEMATTLQAGVAPVAHSYLSPNQPAYREIEARLPRYEFDPRRAAHMLESLGYSKGPDGLLVDAAGQRLDVEVRSGAQEQAAKPMFAVVDYWRQLGVAATPLRMTSQQVDHAEFRATFRGFSIHNQPNDIPGLIALHSSRVRLPENGFRVPGSGNWSRYMNPDLDRLIDTYFATIPRPERTRVLGEIIHHVADQLPVIGIYYNPLAQPIANRVVNVGPESPGSVQSWNAHLWDVRA